MTSLSLPSMGPSDLRRFLDKVRKGDSDWLWTGAINKGGYGNFWLAGRYVSAHRVAYRHYVGEIPEGLTIDHLCRVRHCVNPEHLEAVTNRTNLLRGNGFAGRFARTTQCPKGHLYDAANTRIGACGSRYCRACDALAHRLARARARA